MAILQKPVRTHRFIFSDRKKEALEITPISATQSKTFEDKKTKYGAANAIDQDLSTSAGINTENGVGWLKLHFNRTYHVKKIIIYYKFSDYWYFPNSTCIGPSETIICANMDDNVEVSVYQGEVKQKSCGTLKLKHGLDQSDQIYPMECDAKGDTVKLSKNESGNIAVYEVVAISRDPGKQKQKANKTKLCKRGERFAQ